MLDGEIVGAAVAGYAFVDFSQISEVQVLARHSGIAFERLWRVAREQKPIPRHRLILNGELLQILGDALLREHCRTLQYQEAALKLDEAAREKEKADHELRKHQELLHKSEKLVAAGQLAASLAHEINNPLSSVTNALYLLERNASLDETVRSLAKIAASELARVARIVKQSLCYYRVGSTPRDLDLAAVVNESLAIFQGKLQRAGIEVIARISSGVLTGFPDELRQMVDNLLVNALEAMPSGGRLSVSVHPSFDWTPREKHQRGVRFTISDSGSGISKDCRTHIFEPFFTTKSEKGTGLGLWVVEGIIAKHQGDMRLRSSDAKGASGTVISIFLPSHANGLRGVELPTESAA